MRLLSHGLSQQDRRLRGTLTGKHALRWSERQWRRSSLTVHRLIYMGLLNTQQGMVSTLPVRDNGCWQQHAMGIQDRQHTA